MTDTVLGTCHHDCPDSCGWVATVEDQPASGVQSSQRVVVKLRGNPDHPFSQGELCPKVNRFVDRVYDPHRLLTPLIRTGPKGAAEFRNASWDEALALVAERIGEITTTYGGEAVLPWWDAGTQGMIQESSLDRRFFAKLGSSRRTGSLCGATASAGIWGTYGSPRAAEPSNVQFADLVVIWATNTKLTNRHLWPFVESARANGARIVAIDTMRTATVEAADEFIQPLPGTDVALMLAMMHVLIRDNLIDAKYIESHATGFAELTEHVAAWTPQRAEAICGVDAGVIEQLATTYGNTPQSFISTLIGAEHHENGAMFFRTLACLPVLTGAWRHPGGGLSKSSGSWFDDNVDLSTFDRPNLSDGSHRRGVSMNHLGRALTELDDPPVKALFAWNGNPAVTVPNSALIRQGLLRDDLFTVVSEQFMTDTAAHADVVFPATTQLEQIDVVPAWGHMYLGWNEAAIAPLGDCVPNTELWRRLSAAMGFTEPELFETDEQLIDSALRGIDLDELRRTGFVRIDVEADHNPYTNGGFATPSGKAELASDRLGDMGQPRLPTYTAPTERPEHGDQPYPLYLTSPKHHTRFLNSSYASLPKHGPREGGPFVELDPHDAASRGLGEGDDAEIFNDRARLTLPVRISQRLRPGLVAIPFGWWTNDHPDGQTVNALTSDALSDWGGGVAYGDTLVQVAAATPDNPT